MVLAVTGSSPVGRPEIEIPRKRDFCFGGLSVRSARRDSKAGAMFSQQRKPRGGAATKASDGAPRVVAESRRSSQEFDESRCRSIVKAAISLSFDKDCVSPGKDMS